MPYYKGMVQFITADGRFSHSGDLLDCHFYANNTDQAMDMFLATRTPFVQRRAIAIEVVHYLMAQMDRHARQYGDAFRRELAPTMGAIPPVWTRGPSVCPIGGNVQYRNHQWLVSDRGIHTTPDVVHEAAVHLDELNMRSERDGRLLYDWPAHFAHYSWVDQYAFADAFEQAFAHNKIEGFDRKLYNQSIYWARSHALGLQGKPDRFPAVEDRPAAG
jgi:hypothetical protein